MKKIFTLTLAALLAGVAAPSVLGAVHFDGKRALKTRVKAKAATGAPKVLPATDITAEGFTANWEATADDGYAVFVYSKEKVDKAGEYAVLYENFNLISAGSQIEPEFPGDFLTELNEWQTITPDWSVIECSYAGGKIGGVILSPYMDLTNNGGHFTLTLGIVGYAGQVIEVESNGSSEVTQTKTLTEPGYNEISFEFDNGTHDTYVTITDLGFPDDTEGLYVDKVAYLDDFLCTQRCNPGDEILHLVATGESETNSCSFASMPYRYDATRLYYDLYGTSFVYNDPDDPWDYDVNYTPFSDLQEVRLLGDPDDVALDRIEADDSAPVEFFNLQGVRVDNPANGIFIRRQGNKAEKVNL